MLSMDMLLSKSGNSRYKLVVIASKRALELAEGRPRLTQAEGMAYAKPSIVALEEISEGLVELKTK